MAADPSRISTRARKTCYEAAPDRIGRGGEHNGYRPRFSQQRCNIGRSTGDDYIACKGDKLFGVNLMLLRISARPSNFEPKVSSDVPTELREAALKGGDPRSSALIRFSVAQEYSNETGSLLPLRAGC